MGHHITDLCEKLDFLVMQPEARKKHGCNSIAALAEESDIPAPSLKTLKDPARNKYGRISADDEGKLSKACGFDPKWPEWRTGTTEAFKARYLKECSITGKNDPPSSERKLGLRLKASRPFQAEAADAMLASVELNVSQAGPDDPWLLSADLACWPAPIGGFEIAVKRGRLEFDCAGAQSAELKERMGSPSGLTIERETGNIVLRPFGTSQKPGWGVQANGVIGVLSLPYDLCPVKDIAAGEVMEVRFSAYVKDLELTESEDEDNEPDGEGQPENESYSFIRPSMKKLGAAKEKILKRMAEMQLPGGAEGWSVLCRDARRFDAADEDGEA